MAGDSTVARAYSALTLRQTRAQLRTWWGVAMVASIGLVFGFISMLVGQMLVFERIGGAYGYEVVWGQGSSAWWNFPGLLLVEPWGLVALPFLPTVAMVLVSYGVGLGMSIAVLISVRTWRARRTALGRPTAVSSVTGLTPAMIALVTLGACCSTTAAATAGIGVAAQTSGSSVNALLENNWYLNVFQLVILWVALVAQEQLLVAYGLFFGPSTTEPAPTVRPDPWAVPRRLARVALLLGGVTWSLTTLASWTTQAPASAGVGEWLHWLVQQQVPALLAVAFALSPGGLARFAKEKWVGAPGLVLRGLFLIAGLSLLLWLPPAAVVSGLFGWGNEVLGSFGLAASTGAASISPFSGWGLLFHWLFQLLLLGGFAVAVAVDPERTMRMFATSDQAQTRTSRSASAEILAERPTIAAASGGSGEP